MKNILTFLALATVIMSVSAMANKKYDNVLVIGAEESTEKVNLKLLDQTDDRSSEIRNSKVLNFKAESIRDTNRKSFHSLRNVEEVSNDEMLIIK
jgi:hypothetical protein